ncbi:MAG: YheC/YheD family protein [archaeon]
MKDIFVVGDERTINSKIDFTFPVFASLPNVKSYTFQELMRNKKPMASEVPVLVCFPYELWDEIVETGNGLYGLGSFRDPIKLFAEYLTSFLDKNFPKARFVNDPMSIIIERDKYLTKQILKKEGISVAKDIDKTLNSVLKEVEFGRSVYIKPRYGSLGKGITYVSPKKWTTNFKYDGNNIENHDDDKDWNEIEITGDTEFLKKILSEDVVVEKAIVNSKTNGFKLDLRVTSIYETINPKFAYARVTSDKSVTNISQGAKEMSLEKLMEFVPKQQVEKALKLIRNCSKILNLNYAGGDVLFEGENFEPVFLEINSYPGPYKSRELFPVLYEEIFSKFYRMQELTDEMQYNQSLYPI